MNGASPLEGFASDEDLAAAAPGLLVRAAALAVGAAGVFTALLGAQTLANVRFLGWQGVLPYSMLALGAATLGVAWKLGRARGWAAIAGAILTAFTALGALAWTVFAILFGYLSLLSLMVAGLAVVGAVLAAVAAPACARADAARLRLTAQGFDLGI